MSIPCPEELGKFSTFHRTFLDFEQKDEVVSYACLLYTVSKVIKSETITPALKSYISQALGRLESWKQEFTNTSYNEIISNETILGNHLSNVANKIFSWAETNDLAQNYTTDVIKSYYLSSVLFIVAAHFVGEGDANDDDIKRKFAMQRSVYIKRCLKLNKPISNYDSYCAAFDESLGITSSTLPTTNDQTSGLSTGPTTIAPANTPQLHDISYSTYSSSNQPTSTLSNSQSLPLNPSYGSSEKIDPNVGVRAYISNSVYNAIKPNNTQWPTPIPSCNQDVLNDSGIDYNTSQEAQKLIKHAGSALSYDDVDTALNLLYKAISLIKPFSKKS